jgi:agmatinase
MARNSTKTEPGLTFAGFPACESPSAVEADIGILGLPYATPQPYGPLPYAGASADPLLTSFGDTSLGPDSVRKMSQRYAPYLTHFDFDLGGDLLAGSGVRVVDCGDVDLTSPRAEENGRRAEDAVRELLQCGTIPIVLGGDHATTIPVLRAYDGYDSICVVQIDAHLDWRDEVSGRHDGLSSPMRRASEMPWVKSMVQIGLRGFGSARAQEVRDAQEYGSILIRAEDMHREGIEWALRKIPESKMYYLTVDTDGIDPAIAPEVGGPGPGGLTYYQVVALLRELTSRGRIVGADFVELAFDPDFKGKTSLLISRIVLVLIGLMSRNSFMQSNA